MQHYKKRLLRGEKCQSTMHLPYAVSISEATFWFSMFWSVAMADLKQQIESAHVLKLSKLINSSAHYQNPRDMRFFGAGRLC